MASHKTFFGKLFGWIGDLFHNANQDFLQTAIVRPERNNGFAKVYEIKKFRKDQVDRLIKSKRRARDRSIPDYEVFGKILMPASTGRGRRAKIIELYEGKETSLSFTPTRIVTLQKVYHLQAPLSCLLFKENDYYVIQHELLDLFASGSTVNDAEMDFYNEFDMAYNRFMETPDDQLSDRLLRAKQAMKLFIKEITAD